MFTSTSTSSAIPLILFECLACGLFHHNTSVAISYRLSKLSAINGFLSLLAFLPYSLKDQALGVRVCQVRLGLNEGPYYIVPKLLVASISASMSSVLPHWDTTDTLRLVGSAGRIALFSHRPIPQSHRTVLRTGNCNTQLEFTQVLENEERVCGWEGRMCSGNDSDRIILCLIVITLAPPMLVG